jgi:hypothetical protein
VEWLGPLGSLSAVQPDIRHHSVSSPRVADNAGHYCSDTEALSQTFTCTWLSKLTQAPWVADNAWHYCSDTDSSQPDIHLHVTLQGCWQCRALLHATDSSQPDIHKLDIFLSSKDVPERDKRHLHRHNEVYLDNIGNDLVSTSSWGFSKCNSRYWTLSAQMSWIPFLLYWYSNQEATVQWHEKIGFHR